MIIYRGTCVLAEFTTTSGNFTTITRRILEKIPRADTSMSYVYDRHVFHYVVHEGLVFLCMADQGFGNQIPFSFLEDIMRRWVDAYGERGQTALAYGMNEDFSRVLQRQMDFYSRDKGVERMSRVRGEIDEVKAVMVENIEKVLERGEKIELLVDKSENLNQQAFKFKKQSTALRRAMWCKNVKMMLLIGFGIAVVVLLIVMGACGWDFHKCRASDSGGDHGSGNHSDDTVSEAIVGATGDPPSFYSAATH